jgi:glycolate oxidase FAD binding subunit
LAVATHTLPVSGTHQPADQQQAAAVVRECCESGTPVYPVGGGTSLDFGLPATQQGIALSLSGLNRIVDYPARDMTITAEAGVTMRALREALAREGQQLPFDVPHEDRATLGGVVATNFNGPRRYGYGGVRDYVIGVSAVDGCGRPFKGGGRVVKNVAGYDFCKLLTGSLGTLGVITQLTMKLKPLPEKSELLACSAADLDQAERLLAALAGSKTTPSAIELLSGPAWSDDAAVGELVREKNGGAAIVVGLEGTAAEVDWMRGQLATELREHGARSHRSLAGDGAASLWRRLAEFPAGEAALTLKISVVPSAVTRLVALLREIEPRASLQAHAGSGVIVARLPELPKGGLSRTVVGRLQPAAAAAHGHAIVLANPTGAEATHQSVWGGTDVPYWLMTEVKRKFDPKHILNPGRFVYQGA